MIDALPTFPTTTTLPCDLAPAPVTGAPATDFGQTLSAFLDARDAAAPPDIAPALPTDRQPLADDGKEVPAATAPDDDTLADAPLAWMFALASPPAPVATPAMPIVADLGSALATPAVRAGPGPRTPTPVDATPATRIPADTAAAVAAPAVGGPSPTVAAPTVAGPGPRTITPFIATPTPPMPAPDIAADPVRKATPRTATPDDAMPDVAQDPAQSAIQRRATRPPATTPAPAPVSVSASVSVPAATLAPTPAAPLLAPTSEVASPRPAPLVMPTPDAVSGARAAAPAQIAPAIVPPPRDVRLAPFADAGNEPAVPVPVPDVAAPLALPVQPARIAGGAQTAGPIRAETPSPTRDVTEQQPQPAPAVQNDAIQVSTNPQPARQVFAAAIAAASRWQEPTRRDADASVAAPALTLDALQRPAVQATAATRDAPLDLTNDHGLQRMIDRIETLRDDAGDSADSRDTRIRLVPDALGGVEIAVRKQGEQVHVHFTAERETTQALLVDAQPRLTELAAARGLRIGETTVSTGNPAPQQQGGNATPQPRTVFTNPRPATADADAPTTDTRLA